MILPGGTVKLGNYEYDVMLNSSPVKVDDFNRMPIKYQNGAMVFIGDVAKASDSHAVQTDIARVNGRRASFRYILKHASASTLTVINEVKAVIPRVQALAPPGTKIFLAFDQSEFVKASLVDVFQEIFHRLGASRPDDGHFSWLVAQHPNRHYFDSARDYDFRSPAFI